MTAPIVYAQFRKIQPRTLLEFLAMLFIPNVLTANWAYYDE
jgi:hypothetical protein